MSTWQPDPETVDQLIELRIARQHILTGASGPYYTFVVDEAALRRGDPGVMRDQLARLLDTPERVRLHVAPLTCSFHAGQTGSFSLATVEQATLGYVEGPSIWDPTSEVDFLQRCWESVRSEALPESLSRDLIMKLVNEL
jgi:hypothetical protein